MPLKGGAGCSHVPRFGGAQRTIEDRLEDHGTAGPALGESDYVGNVDDFQTQDQARDRQPRVHLDGLEDEGRPVVSGNAEDAMVSHGFGGELSPVAVHAAGPRCRTPSPGGRYIQS